MFMACIHEPNPDLPVPRTRTSTISQNRSTGLLPLLLSVPPTPSTSPTTPPRQPTSSLPPTPLQHCLGIPNPRILPLPHPLQRQRRNQRRPHPTPILRGQNLNRILPPRPVQNLPQRDGAARLEVRVLVEDGAVGADVAGFPALLLADGGDAAGGEAGGARAD
jgi:hypothetical protein